jgi:D-serine deaminase-like pyridoxal phosphate-dependent protein
MKQILSTRRQSPNTHLIGAPDSRARLATPALLLDLDAFEYNVAAMSAYCRAANLGLRAHFKANKCTRIAALQKAAGAKGLAAATVREAEALIAAGLGDVLITSPVVGETKLGELCALLAAGAEPTVVVDNFGQIQALEIALGPEHKALSVLVDIDVGMKRTGVPTVAEAVRLCNALKFSKNLKYAGLQCYSGMVQHIAGAAERAAVYEAELKHLAAVLLELKRAGLAPSIVSGGGTGTFDIDRRMQLFTEVQCGSYVFMDVEYDAIELFANDAKPFRRSLFVQSIVLSNNHPGRATIDAGVKSFATDGPTPLPVRGAPAGARYDYDGDEFGALIFADPAEQLALASKVEIFVPHCDPTINLHDFLHCVRGNVLVDIWPVDARGSL